MDILGRTVVQKYLREGMGMGLCPGGMLSSQGKSRSWLPVLMIPSKGSPLSSRYDLYLIHRLTMVNNKSVWWSISIVGLGIYIHIYTDKSFNT